MPSDYIRENLMITTSGVFSFPPLQCAVLALGVHRILFSVDYPYESTKEATEFIEAAPISEPLGASATWATASISAPASVRA